MTNFSQTYFGKDREKLTLKDIENFFSNPQVESDSIEFKSFIAAQPLDKQYENVYRSIIAFLNSNGGILIWGSPVGVIPTGTKEKIFQGALTPINVLLQKDSLISKVSNKITPLPNNINVKIIPNGKQCICVFEVQKSLHAHQINGTYFMRLDGQTVPAPHHYVEALIKQITYPDIEAYLKINTFDYLSTKDAYRLSIEIVIWNWSQLQNERNPSFRLTIHPGVFDGKGKYDLNGAQWIMENVAEVLHYGAPIASSNFIVISENQMRQHNNEMELLLGLGGRYSPFRVSDYKLHLRKLNPGENPNNLIVEKKENIFSHEQPESMSASKEDKLKRILNR